MVWKVGDVGWVWNQVGDKEGRVWKQVGDDEEWVWWQINWCADTLHGLVGE
jgi:hypothetical protein